MFHPDPKMMGKSFMKLYGDDVPVKVELYHCSAALMSLRTSVWNVDCSHSARCYVPHMCFRSH